MEKINTIEELRSFKARLLPEIGEKMRSHTVVYKGRVLDFTTDEVTLPNGAAAPREVVRHKGAVCVLPLTEEGNVICVFQHRYPFDEILCEIPAGKLDPGEEPLHAAVRELEEETGAAAEKIRFIGLYYPSPAILDEKIYMYLAEGLTFREQHLDADEFLFVKEIPLSLLCDMIASGEIRDGKTQAAVLKTRYILEKEEDR